MVLPSLKRTFDNAFDMFARSRERPYQMVWDDLGHRMEREEGIGLLERLEWYHDFLRAQFDVLTGYQPQDLRDLRRQLISLRDAQDVSILRDQRRSIDASGTIGYRGSAWATHASQTNIWAATSTPRPPVRPPLTRIETPISPTTMSDDWDDYTQRTGMPPPIAPDPPLQVPTSPTFTSSSSQSLDSSHTSYSNGSFTPSAPALVHWAQVVFDGNNPSTQFRQQYQL